MAFTARAATEPRSQLDASPTIFTVMAAMDAAGIGIDPASPANVPLRSQVRDEILKRDVPSLVELKKFFAIHRQKNDTLELNQYISWALSVGPAPDFDARHRDVDLPPDAAPLMELGSLLTPFYKEAHIEELWKRSQPAIDNYLGRYHEGVSQAVFVVNTYLRQQTSGFKGRTFQVYVELLGPPNQIQTRSYGNEYTIVLTPSAEPQIHDVRHAYLHYLLDPLSTRYQEIVMRKQAISEHAQRAPALGESFKSDFLLLTTESLIQAVEARLDRRPQQVDEALKEGYILAPYFSEALAGFEKQEQAMLLYFPDMVKAIELRKEEARLAPVEFAQEARVRHARSLTAAPPPVTGAAKSIEDADELVRGREFDKARALYLKAIEQTGEKPLQAQAYYGMARMALMQKEKDPELAEKLFLKTLDLGPEARVKAWALVYLGRLALAQTEPDREAAAKYLRASLEVKDAPAEARKAAEQALQQSGKP
jgi:tetratricopeptide (TPR) repeat protein